MIHLYADHNYTVETSKMQARAGIIVGVISFSGTL